MAHIKMLDMYNDIPDSYNIQKMIYNYGSTLQDLINHLKNQKMMLGLMIIIIKPCLSWSRMS